MKRVVRLLPLVAALAVAACGPTPIPSPTVVSPLPSASPSKPTQPPTPAASPVVACGDMASADCQQAVQTVLATIATQAKTHGSVTRVDLGRGVFCPTPGLLFENTTCPAGSLPPPQGGQWIGHALVSFAGTPEQGYLNVGNNGATYFCALIDVATPPPPTQQPS